MFTGIITDIGTIIDFRKEGDVIYRIKTHYDTEIVALGASIACDGCCLTVIQKGADWFEMQASLETLSKTNLGGWKIGTRINLERALKMGDELGGHIVSGHVDGLVKVVSIEPVGGSWKITFNAPEALKRFIAPKGSVTLNGVSLTVNDVKDNHFSVNIIPHTWEVTTFGQLKAGDDVNLEIDMLARYMARMLEK
jgi:riboflavin synthase